MAAAGLAGLDVDVEYPVQALRLTAMALPPILPRGLATVIAVFADPDLAWDGVLKPGTSAQMGTRAGRFGNREI